jgi:general secretion pathway protein A
MTSIAPPKQGRSGSASALSDYIRRAESRFSRQTALTEVLAAWGAAFEAKPDLAAIEDDPTFFNLSAKTAGFFVQRLETDLKILRNLNMPAILEFRLSNKPTYAYLALTRLDGPTFLFKSGPGDHLIESQAEEFTPYWTSVAFVPWKNFLSLTGTIPGNAQADSILALKMLLRDLGYTDVSLNTDYDDSTQKAIEQIQAKYGIPVDGIVGNLTKIILYREGQRFDIPRLVSN